MTGGNISMNGAVLLGLMVPFVGTALGAMMVVFVKSEMNHNMQRAFTGFARSYGLCFVF